MLELAVQISIGLVALKAMIVGSDYEPITHIRYGKQYWNYYKNRPKFDKNKIYWLKKEIF